MEMQANSVQHDKNASFSPLLAWICSWTSAMADDSHVFPAAVVTLLRLLPEAQLKFGGSLMAEEPLLEWGGPDSQLGRRGAHEQQLC